MAGPAAGRRQGGRARRQERDQDARAARRLRPRGRFAWRPLRHRRGRRHERHRHDRDRDARPNIVAGLAGAEGGAVGGDPGPHTSLGVFLGIKAAVSARWARTALKRPAHRAAGRRQRRRRRRAACRRRRRQADRSPTSMPARAKKLAGETGGTVVDPSDIMTLEARRAQPQRARRDPRRAVDRRARTCRSSPAAPTTSWPRRRTARGCTRAASSMRPIMSSTPAASSTSRPNISATAAPDLVRSRIEAIPGRLEQIWAESAASGRDPAAVADAMAQRLIGRG